MPKLLLIFLVGLVTWLRIASGAETYFNVTDEGIAIGGYDVVAYFVQGKPRRGLSEYSFAWKGADWHFENPANRTLFSHSPETYTPSFGGWCSMAMSGGRVVEVDFENAWLVSSGKLYFNVNESVHRRWLRGQNRLIRKANEHWPGAREAIETGEAQIVRKTELPDWY